MGRYSTGIFTTNQVQRIELSYLLKHGFIIKNSIVSGTISWSNGNTIRFESKYFDSEAFIRLIYTNTKHSTNEVTEHDYKIQLETVPSNLGKGELVYFICPVSGKRCRILYKVYDSKIWKSRGAYQNRIYYQTQLESKILRPYKYMFVDSLLDELYRKKKKSHYKGKPTRIMKRIAELERKNDLAMMGYDKFERLLCGIK